MSDRRGTEKKRNKIWSLFVLRIKNLNREGRINTPGSLIVLQRKSMMTVTESYWVGIQQWFGVGLDARDSSQGERSRKALQ